MPALDVRGVTKTYGTKVASDAITLVVEPGEIFGLLGPNGAGKTTLLRMAMDIIKPDSGEIFVLDAPISPAIKQRIGYLPEERGLYPRQRTGEVLKFIGELKGLPGHVAARRAESYLDRVGLLEARRKRIRELSKGMQQKVQLASVLLTEPDLVVLDEPFEGLDPVNRVVVTDLIEEFRARGTAIVLSSHRMEQVEKLCRHVFLINHGQAVLSGEVRELKERFADNSVIVEADRDVSGHPLVERAEENKLWLKGEPEAFMASLLSEGIRLRRFERALPSLDDIFVRAVRS
jgi:ABC-2 type transport system ATP-binding protein